MTAPCHFRQVDTRAAAAAGGDVSFCWAGVFCYGFEVAVCVCVRVVGIPRLCAGSRGLVLFSLLAGNARRSIKSLFVYVSLSVSLRVLVRVCVCIRISVMRLRARSRRGSLSHCHPSSLVKAEKHVKARNKG